MKDRLWSSGLVVVVLFLLACYHFREQGLLEVVEDTGSFLCRLFGH